MGIFSQEERKMIEKENENSNEKVSEIDFSLIFVKAIFSAYSYLFFINSIYIPIECTIRYLNKWRKEALKENLSPLCVVL